MLENVQYSLSEILYLRTEPDRELIRRKDAIKLMLQTASTAPETDWAQLSPLTSFEPIVQGMFMRASSDFHSARQATLFWENAYLNDNERVKKEIKRKHEFPKETDIHSIEFYGDACGLVMSFKHVQDVYRARRLQEGVIVPPSFYIFGVADSGIYLEDREGNKCPTIIIPTVEDMIARKEDRESIIEHEVAHIRTKRYYFREILEKDEESSVTLAETAKLSVLNHIVKRNPDLDNEALIERTVLLHTRALTKSSIDLYYNEMISEGSSTRLAESSLFSRNIFNFEYTNPDHIYGRDIAQSLDGLVAALLETNLGFESKMVIWRKIEEDLGRFFNKLRLLSTLLKENWDDVRNANGYDTEEFLSRMYAVSTMEPWKLGIFIDKNITSLQEEFEADPEDLSLLTRLGIVNRNLSSIKDEDILAYQQRARSSDLQY
ncbi:MAG TPA: hypothetical protein VLF89_01825 [Candidatus Saccharimonadales bacterium]|nr:hypothetical protein [Candidatus Saccharimonadales bacterium]